MKRPGEQTIVGDDAPPRPPRHADPGNTFVELLVAIVLIGTSVVATLVALQATTRATITDREHARALGWLQAAADEIYNAPRVACHDQSTPAESAALAVGEYADAARLAEPPEGWDPSSIEVTAVQFIGRTSSADLYSWSASFCLESAPSACPGGAYCNSPQTAQKVTLRVTTPSGLVRTLDTVKSA